MDPAIVAAIVTGLLGILAACIPYLLKIWRERKNSLDRALDAPRGPAVVTENAVLSTYRQAVADRWRSVRILRHHLDIERHYFRARAEHVGDDGQAVDAVNLLLAEEPRRICLFGPSGSGKTAAVRRLVWESSAEGRVPFFIRLRDHTSPTRDESDQVVDLIPWLEAAVTRHQAAGCLDELKRRIRDRRGLFVFDGFDELRFEPTRAARIAEAIETFFAGPYEEAKVVVTSRTEEDLQGRFSGYALYRLLPVGKDQLKDFAKTLELNLPVVNPLLDELTQRPFFELRPLMLLIALLGIDATSLTDLEGIDSHYELLERVLGHLLRDKRQVPPSEELRSLTPEDVRSLRFHLLESMVRGWETSGKPVRLRESQVRAYAQQAFRAVLKHELPAVQALKFLVPTGICLESEERGEIWYGFVHNSFQEFLYARVLRQYLRAARTEDGRAGSSPPSDRKLLERDYYSAEILGLLGEALTRADIETLLEWAMESERGQMVRKVSLGALGFVRRQYVPSLRPRLLKAFEKEKEDIGIAGRIVEALRRLGDPSALAIFVEQLDRYPPRPVRPGSLERPLTYEINEPLPGIEQFSERLGQHLEHRDSVIRKHALILLMRGRELPLHWVVRFCLREVEAAEQAGSTAAAPAGGVVEYLRSLRYGLEALRRLGTRAELELAEHLWQRLAGLQSNHEIVMEDLERVQKRLQRSPRTFWEHDLEPADGLDVYLIRHGESDGNRDHRFLGSQKGGVLTDLGRRQAEALAGHLRERLGEARSGGVVRLVSAPTGRARETSEILRAALPGVAVELEPLITEINFGTWTGKTKTEVHEENPELYSAWRADPWKHPPPHGESLAEVRSRAFTGFLRQIRKTLELQLRPAAGGGPSAATSTLILVGHFFPLAEIFQTATQQPMDPRPVNCAVNRLRLTRNDCRVVELDETDHLAGPGFERVRFDHPGTTA